MAWVFLWSSLGSLQSAEFPGHVVTFNGRDRVQVKADEWMVRGQLIQESVYRSVVEERLKAQVRCLEVDLERFQLLVINLAIKCNIRRCLQLNGATRKLLQKEVSIEKR